MTIEDMHEDMRAGWQTLMKIRRYRRIGTGWFVAVLVAMEIGQGQGA